MGQPPRAAEIRVAYDVCPECRSTTTTVTLKSNIGVDCRCTKCDHVWKQERVTH